MTTSFSFVAGHLALDLLNTVDWRLDATRRTERLQGFADVLAWCLQCGVIDQAEHRALTARADANTTAATDATARFVDLREQAYDAVFDYDREALDALAQRHQVALGRSSLIGAATWTWKDDRLGLDTPADRVVRALIDLITSDQIAAKHQCEDDSCGWVFLDTSPRHNRRWCSASDCGDRNRARAYYQRKTTST